MPIPGSPPTRTIEPGDDARRRGPGRARRCRTGGAGRPAPATDASGGRDGRGRTRRGRAAAAAAPRLADDGLDEAVPGAAGAALALPAEERLAARLADVAALRLAAARVTPAAAAAAGDQPASTGVSVSAAWMSRPASGSCRRRSSCPARTCRAGGARRGRPRSCSGSPGGAGGRRRPRRSRA